MKRPGILAVVFALLFAASCEKDPDIAEWKEISVVYAVINLKDTVQYLRINRVYSAPQDDPSPYTQINDSVNYPQELFDVYLEEIQNGYPVGEPVKYEAVDRQKEPGMFSNASNCVFRTNMPIKKNARYRLKVVNKKTGHIAYGSASVMGKVTIEESFEWERAFFRVNYVAEPMSEYEGTLDPKEHDHYIVRFLYWENKNGVTSSRYVDWIPTIDQLKSLNNDDTLYQMFDAYWEYLASQIEVDPGVKRQARGIDYMLSLPGEELQTYITVYGQATNPHFYPDYTNMSEGAGVFGSKYYWTYFGMKLQKRTIDTISWGRHLYHHRFSDSRGEWH